MRVENENESFHEKNESRDWEWDANFPWESQFRDRDESLTEVCLVLVFQCFTNMAINATLALSVSLSVVYLGIQMFLNVNQGGKHVW